MDASEFNGVTCSLPRCFPLPSPTSQNADSCAPSEASAYNLDFGGDVRTDVCRVGETATTVPKKNRAAHLLGTKTVPA